MVAAVLIVFAVGAVLELVARRGRVVTPRPERCPVCGHDRLTFAGWWPKQTRLGVVDVHRVLCTAKPCGKTHSCWPDVLVGGRVDAAEVIGAALEAKAAGWAHRRIAGRLGVPECTARGWLRRFALVASTVARALVAAAAAATRWCARRPRETRSRSRWLGPTRRRDGRGCGSAVIGRWWSGSTWGAAIARHAAVRRRPTPR